MKHGAQMEEITGGSSAIRERQFHECRIEESFVCAYIYKRSMKNTVLLLATLLAL